MAVLLLLLLVILSTTSIDAAHAAHKATGRSSKGGRGDERYDRVITTFNDQGRLLQVEYGTLAAHRGKPCVAIKLDIHGRSFVIVVLANHHTSTTTSSALDCDTKPSNNDNNDNDNNDMRLIDEMEVNKVYRIADNALLIPTGLVGDGRTLAKYARQNIMELKRSYGEMLLNVDEIAQDVVGGLQSMLTRSYGARPFGCSALIVGTDFVSMTNNKNEQQLEARMFVSEPGGVVDEYVTYASGQGSDALMKQLVGIRKNVLSRITTNEGGGGGGDSSGAGDDSTLLLSSIVSTDAFVAGVVEDSIEELVKLVLGEQVINVANSVDVWLVEAVSKSRGRCKIKHASGVTKDAIGHAKKCFAV